MLACDKILVIKDGNEKADCVSVCTGKGIYDKQAKEPAKRPADYFPSLLIQFNTFYLSQSARVQIMFSSSASASGHLCIDVLHDLSLHKNV